MKKSNFLAFILLGMSIFGCVQEKITPAFEAQKDPKRSFYVSVPISEITVIDQFGQDIGDIPVVGGIFQELARMFANIAIDNDNGSQVYVEPSLFRFQELNRVDFSIVTKLNLEKVLLKASLRNPDLNLVLENGEEGQKAKDPSLKFIKRLEVYVSHDVEHFEDMKKIYKSKEMPLPLKNSVLLLSYDKKQSPNSLGCDNKCVDLKISDVDWKALLDQNRDFIVQTVLIVDAVPEANMKLGGTVNFSLGIDLGF
ncbi:MAG: hypothetical protein COW00_05040 [Bdellovibrio sp. CG12_big_fil_rev_8_21_14_0_65_39_13]|nr:MAG: hypothetical protein COW78_13240 [Bdellovibrio sp. CG22_combo_CG10-13_8_21_14_all_39_27]PIQ61175.1 MAG: hypothetical protein COW00_05040 [Bdellovibrio sp. CG12_big_fil_rev_8_21_14_0_65_39_13]PIR34846.1 MAG: hypothetical protein COV37_11315 [Bdellovibrio sp. CG11_big_fil_rev_8_21_14_0_20_39_38]PJB53150.1 MAG: hypothetical protein CO099_08705 [Bdellovibrio sp. CG_4_9_14_3_um_filter_39_7]